LSGAILINAIVKTKIPKFERVTLRFDSSRIDAWANEHRIMAPALLTLANEGCANYDSCAPEIGYRCQFFEYCHGVKEDRELLYLKEEKPDAT